MPIPAVSVIICVHNGSQFIQETLETVLDQTLQNFEVIIVDDGSTDGSAELVEREFPDSRITIVRQRQQTLRVARPIGVAHAKGEFLAFLDHDDLWLPRKLERQLSVARESPDVGLLFCDCMFVNDRGEPIGRLSDGYDFESMELNGGRAYFELLRRGCFVAYPTAFARAATVRAVGGFSPGYQYVSDYELWLRLARHGSIRYISEPLAKYRVHRSQFTQQHSEITLAEHTGLLLPISLSASYPRWLRSTIAHNLFGQHRVAFGLLFGQRRFRHALNAAVTSLRYPIPFRDYMHHRLVKSSIGRLLRSVAKQVVKTVLAVARRLQHARRRRLRVVEAESSHSTATEVWIDGSCLDGEATGYVNLVAELIRSLTQSPNHLMHVVTSAAGRSALLARLQGDSERVRFHRLGWRRMHWSHLHRIICSGHVQVIVALGIALLLAWAVAGDKRAVLVVALLLAVGQMSVLFDEVITALLAAHGRARLGFAARALRFFWHRAPLRWRSSRARTAEVLFWRGRFKWRNSRRIAVVQDLTAMIHPEVHTEENAVEFREYLAYVERYAHAVATVSDNSRRDVIRYTQINPDSLHVIPMPVQPQYKQPRFSDGFVVAYNIREPYVLAVSTLEPRKNLRRLVRAFERVKHATAAARQYLVLAGPSGWDSEFRRFLVESDAYPWIVLPGFVSPEHLPSLYHFASAVVYPSVYEGFGLPVLEAMCCSGLVLASRVSSIPEVLGDDGIMFDPFDTDDIARVLLAALELSPEDAASYRRRCRKRAEDHLARLARDGAFSGLLFEGQTVPR